MKTKIYVLTEPDGKIRYVGKTYRSLQSRFNEHLSKARRGEQCHRGDWIRSLFNKGFLPILQLIGEVEGSGIKEEIAWIKYFNLEGIDLVNNTSGGDGVIGHVYTQEQRKRMQKSAIKRFQRPEEREMARSKQLGKKLSPAAIEKIKYHSNLFWSNPRSREKRRIQTVAFWKSNPIEKEKLRIRMIEQNPRKRKFA